MCTKGIITSSFMTAVRFTLSALLFCLLIETGHVGSYQWGEPLSQRHRLHPSGETAQPTRSESTWKDLTHMNAVVHTFPVPIDRHSHATPPKLINLIRHRPLRKSLKGLNISPGRGSAHCLWRSIGFLCGTCTCPRATLTCKRSNTEMRSALLQAWSALCLGGKRLLRVIHDWQNRRYTKPRTAWPLHDV